MLESTSPRANQRGQALPFVGIFLMVFMAMVVLAVDVGWMALTKAELQAASDAASMAAVLELRDGRTRAEAVAAARQIASANSAAGAPVLLNPGVDVVFGGYGNNQFVPGNVNGTTAVQVIARRTSTAPGGALELLVGRVMGVDHTDVAAAAVASIGKRDIVLVQDITYSFIEEINDAKNADRDFVGAMSRQGLSGDRIGIVTFNEAATEQLPISPIPAQETNALAAISRISACLSPQMVNCGGTHIAAGFDTATAMLRTQSDAEAEKVIVLVSDGMPYPSYRKQPAIASADAADDAGVNIFTVTLTAEPGVANGGSGADAAFNAQLVRGFGKAYQTPDAKQLDDILVSILKAMPARLVQ